MDGERVLLEAWREEEPLQYYVHHSEGFLEELLQKQGAHADGARERLVLSLHASSPSQKTSLRSPLARSTTKRLPGSLLEKADLHEGCFPVLDEALLDALRDGFTGLRFVLCPPYSADADFGWDRFPLLEKAFASWLTGKPATIHLLVPIEGLTVDGAAFLRSSPFPLRIEPVSQPDIYLHLQRGHANDSRPAAQPAKEPHFTNLAATCLRVLLSESEASGAIERALSLLSGLLNIRVRYYELSRDAERCLLFRSSGGYRDRPPPAPDPLHGLPLHEALPSVQSGLQVQDCFGGTWEAFDLKERSRLLELFVENAPLWIPIGPRGLPTGALLVEAAEASSLPPDAISALSAVASGIGLVQTREQAQDRLSVSEERFRSLSRLTSDYIYSVRLQPNGEFHLEWLSEAFARDTGHRLRVLQALQDLSGLVTDADLPLLREHLKTLISGRRSVATFTLLTASRIPRRLRNEAWPVWDVNGGVVTRIVGCARDTTDVEALAGRMALLEAEKRAVLDSSHDSVLVLRLEGNPPTAIIQEASQSCLELERTTAPELEGKPLVALFGDLAKDLVPLLKKAAGTGSTEVWPPTLLPGRGEGGWRGGKITPLPNDMFVLVYRDSSESIAWERRNQQLETQLTEARRLQATGRLAWALSHELNNKLTPVIGFSELVLELMGRENPLSSDMATIYQSALEAHHISRDTMELMDSSAPIPLVLDLVSEITLWKKLLKKLLSDHLELQVYIRMQQARIRAEQTVLPQLLIEVSCLANALLPSRGALTVTLEPAAAPIADGERGQVRLELKLSAPSLSERVSSWQQLSSSRSADSVVSPRELEILARRLNATLTLTNDGPDHLILTLELASVRSEAQDWPLAPALRDMNTELIMVIEDDDQVRRFVRRTLETQGFATLEAASMQDALAILRGTDQDQPHLLISDILLADGHVFDLFDALPTLKRKWILMSGYPTDRIAQIANGRPLPPLLRKPFFASELAALVRKILDS